jgi:hypothetical protein
MTTPLKAKIHGCAHSDQFRDVPVFEEVKMRDLDRKAADGGRQFLEVVLLGYVKSDVLKELSEKPDWDLSKLRFSILLNETPILIETFEDMCSEFSGRMLEHRAQKSGLADFEAAVKRQAKVLFENTMKGIEEKAYELTEQLRHLTDSAGSIVEREWNAPFAFQVTDEMRTAGFNVLANASGQDLNDPKLIEQIYHAMVGKRDENFGRKKLKLPDAHDDVKRDAHERLGRIETLDEVKKVLDAHGIQYE